MDVLYIFISIAFFCWIIRNVLFWVYLWQSKEYRIDRLLIHLRETFQGRQLFLSRLSLIKLAVLIVAFILSTGSSSLLFIQISIAILFIFEMILVIREVTTKILFYPNFTLKTIIILLLSFVILVGFYAFRLLDDEFIWLLVLDRLVPFIVSLFVLLFIIPTNLYKEWQIERAMKKMQKSRHMIVIGIAGSYGKTTTQEYLSQIIRRKMTVVKTAKNNSTAFGIAETIMDKITNKTNVFIVELGMYTKQEMRQMSEIIHPTIAVVTGINAQHASVSGSVKETIAAKYELIQALPKNGIALFNGEDDLAYKLYKRTRKNRVLYYTTKKFGDVRYGISAKHIKVNKSYLSFDAIIDGTQVGVRTPLIGEQNVNSLLAAMYLAHYLGMSFTDIKLAVGRLSQPPKTMNKLDGQNGATYVDDTLNTNPSAIDAALSYMKLYKGKKIFVLQPMVELGDEAYAVHLNLAREMSTICDVLFLTNKNFWKPISQGIIKGKGECTIITTSIPKIVDYIKENTQTGDIVLFEGREAGVVLQKLM